MPQSAQMGFLLQCRTFRQCVETQKFNEFSSRLRRAVRQQPLTDEFHSILASKGETHFKCYTDPKETTICNATLNRCIASSLWERSCTHPTNSDGHNWLYTSGMVQRAQTPTEETEFYFLECQTNLCNSNQTISRVSSSMRSTTMICHVFILLQLKALSRRLSDVPRSCQQSIVFSVSTIICYSLSLILSSVEMRRD